MKTNFLLPHRSRPIGYLLFILGTGLFLISNYYSTQLATWAVDEVKVKPGFSPYLPGIIINDVVILSIIVGLLIVAFSREKVEDEMTTRWRLDSLQWAVYINYAVFALCVIFVNGIDFLNILVYNIFIPLVFFIFSFRYKMFTGSRFSKGEE